MLMAASTLGDLPMHRKLEIQRDNRNYRNPHDMQRFVFTHGEKRV